MVNDSVDIPTSEKQDGNGAEPPPGLYTHQAAKQHQEQKQSESIVSVSAASFAGKLIPPRRWAIEDWVPTGYVTGLGGPPGVAKSLLGMQMCSLYVAGMPFLGSAVEKRPALFLSCEDDIDELQRRQASINAALGVGWHDLTDLYFVSRVGAENYLVHMTDGLMVRTALFSELDTVMRTLGIGLLVLDVIPDFWNGNENDRQQVNTFVKSHLAKLAQDHNAGVIALYHPSKAGMNTDGSSGSTAWDGSFRSRMYLSRPETDGKPDLESNERVLRRLKANYAPTAEHSLTWRDGYLYERGAQSQTDERLERWKTSFLHCLQWCEQNDREISPSPQSPQYYGRHFPELIQQIDRRRARVTRKQFEKAYLSLLYEGAIREAQDSRNNKGPRLHFVGYGRT